MHYYLQITTKGHVEKYSSNTVTRLLKQIHKTLSEVSLTYEKSMMPTIYTFRRDIKKQPISNVLSYGVEDSLIQITKCTYLPKTDK